MARWRRRGRASKPVALTLHNLGAVRRDEGSRAAAARLQAAALRILRAALPSGDARLATVAMNTGSDWLEAGAADRAEPLLAEALEIFDEVHAEQPRHPERREAAQWLAACLLARALGLGPISCG